MRKNGAVRVLHFCESFSPLSETFIYDLITELEKQQGGQYVVALNLANQLERPFPRVVGIERPGRWDPTRLWCRLGASVGAWPVWRSDWPAIQRRLMKVVQRVHPDVLHGHFATAGSMLVSVAERCALPLFVSFYGFDASSLFNESDWFSEMKRGIFRRAEIIALSEHMKALLVQRGANAERTHIVHLGKRLDEYHFNPPPRVRHFLSVGRMTEKKGHLDTLRALAPISADWPEMRLDIVGAGEQLSEVEDFVERMGLGSKVTLRGPLPHQGVKQLLLQSDAFILCSRLAENGDSEGTPTAILEAQAAGLPCISTFHAGIPETIPSENHFLLAKERDHVAISARIVHLLEADQSELNEIATRGRLHVERLHNVTLEAGRLYSLYAAHH